MFGSTSSPSRMEIKEALAQMRDSCLMEAANLAYREAERAEANGRCQETALMIGDAIRGLMREQR